MRAATPGIQFAFIVPPWSPGGSTGACPLQCNGYAHRKSLRISRLVRRHCPRAWTDAVLSNASPILDRGAKTTGGVFRSGASPLRLAGVSSPAGPLDHRKTRGEDALKMPTGFFVGNELDFATRKPRGRLELDPTHLLTHGLIVGMTRSRQTGLAILLL